MEGWRVVVTPGLPLKGELIYVLPNWILRKNTRTQENTSKTDGQSRNRRGRQPEH